MFSIKSSASDRELVFLNGQGDYFTVELKGADLSATCSVWGYTDTEFLVDFFAWLAKQERPWDDKPDWSSIEKEFHISARCSPLGQVSFEIEIRGLQGYSEEWVVQSTITTEIGQLPNIFVGASQFFNVG